MTETRKPESTERYRSAARRAGDWLVNTQTGMENDANRGRFVYARNIATGYVERTTNWQTAFSVIALLSVHKLTNEQKYLDSARLGISYLKSLQIIDPRVRSLHGAIREETPLTNWLHPRDALSAAWGMLVFGRYCGDTDCIERAALFADWMLDHAFYENWPICTVNLGSGGRETDFLLGSFQSGGMLFFLDLYRLTQNARYYETALRMGDFYIEHFMNNKGEITILVDAIGNNADANNLEKWPLDWQNMHRVNDDFGGAALVEGFLVFKREVYRERLKAYFNWLAGMVNDDGSFLSPAVEVGSATVPIFLHRYRSIADAAQWNDIDTLKKRCLEYLLSVQIVSDNPDTNGAFYGMDNTCRAGNRQWINVRITSYAVIALLHQSGISLFPMSHL